MPLLEVGKLKRSKGKRIDCRGFEILPTLPVEGEDIKLAGEVEYRLFLTNTGDAIVVEGTVKADLNVRCNRCLGDMVYPMEAQFQETYFDRNITTPGEIQYEWIPFSGDQIDITPELVQAILVHMPMRFICRDDCHGLCPVCGADLNSRSCGCTQDDSDPRLAKLKDLLS